LSTFRLICADVIDGLRTLPDASIDAVVADPPYGENVAAWDRNIGLDFHVAWITETQRILKPNAPLIAFGSRRRFDLLMGGVRIVRGDSAECPIQMGVWNHRQGFAHTSGHLRPEHEPFVVSGLLRVDSEEVRRIREYQTPHNLNRNPTKRSAASGMARGLKAFTYTPDTIGPIGGTTFDASRNKFAAATGHPSQKPVGVGYYLIALSSAPGQIVCDPFVGSGSFGEAALEMGRDFIGIDKDAGYIDGARSRLTDVASLFTRETAPDEIPVEVPA